jgi:hypothetical protein
MKLNNVRRMNGGPGGFSGGDGDELNESRNITFYTKAL